MTGVASVLFEVDGRYCAVDARRVHSVVDLPPVSSVPFAPVAVEGLVSVGGAIMPLLDFAAWLDGRATDRDAVKRGQVLVLDTGSGRVAARVGRVHALVPDGGFGEHEITMIAAEEIRIGAPAEGTREPGAVGDAEEAAPAAEPRTDPFVVLAFGGERYGVPIGAVREIAPGGGLWPMPAAPPALVGFTYLRGKPVAVLSLSALLGHAPATAGVLIVLARDGGRLALLVEQVIDIRRFRLQAEGSEGHVDDDGTVVVPLDPDRLVPEAIWARFRDDGEGTPAAAVEAEPVRRLVAFTVAGEACALPVEEVERVIEYLQPVRVPPGKHGFTDAIEVGGAIVPLIDVRLQIDASAAAGAPGACLFTRLGRHGHALAIDRLERLMAVPESAIEEIGGEHGPVVGIGRVDERPFWILSARRLIEAAGAATS
jgi:chemotaxis signal transduction protein